MLKEMTDDQLLKHKYNIIQELEKIKIEIEKRGSVKTDFQQAKSLLYFVSQKCGGVDITSNSRKSEDVSIRKSYVWHCRELKIPYETIGKILNRNHSTLIFSQRNFKDDLKYDPKFAEIHQKISFAIKESNFFIEN